MKNTPHLSGLHPRSVRRVGAQPRGGSSRPWRVWLSGVAVLLCAACGSDPDGDGGVDAGSTGDTAAVDTGASCAADGDPCTPSDPCAAQGTCQAGACVGSGAKDCDDGLDCTADTCDAKTGACQHAVTKGQCLIDGACHGATSLKKGAPCMACTPDTANDAWTPWEGNPCDDGDACTTAESCDAKGACVGKAKDCDDGEACTDDSCDAKTGDCQTAFKAGGCDDGDPCTDDGTCVSGKCETGPDKDCGDGDACTKDSCDPKTGTCSSVKDPNACDDGSTCTTDSCDPSAGCAHVNLAKGATCSDGDACTHGEACDATGTCSGGTQAACTDSNPCTDDTCDAKLGCVYPYNAASCSDGESCTVGDKCSGGVCLGQKTTSCQACKKSFGSTAAQLTSFAIGGDGKTGNGLDVDSEPKTCSPKNQCEKGIDNAFAVLAFAVNPVLENAVKSGALRFVADFDGFSGPGKPFAIHLYYAELSSGSVAKSCQPMTQPCGWLVSQQAFTAQCKPRVTFDNAVLTGTALKAGGASTLFAMEVSLQGGDATFVVQGARLEGTLTLAADGKTVTGFDGVIGGSMTEKAVLSTFQGLPADAFAPLTKAGAIALIKSLLVLDIDADGDGKPESASVGLKVSAIGATLEGMAD